MFSMINQNKIEELKEEYPEGSRVELVHMDDPYSRLEPGSQGTVRFVDDMGTIHVSWDSGSSLGLVYGEDSFKKINDKDMEHGMVVNEDPIPAGEEGAYQKEPDVVTQAGKDYVFWR